MERIEKELCSKGVICKNKSQIGTVHDLKINETNDKTIMLKQKIGMQEQATIKPLEQDIKKQTHYRWYCLHI